jgi:hypothetical protein
MAPRRREEAANGVGQVSEHYGNLTRAVVKLFHTDFKD